MTNNGNTAAAIALTTVTTTTTTTTATTTTATATTATTTTVSATPYCCYYTTTTTTRLLLNYCCYYYYRCAHLFQSLVISLQSHEAFCHGTRRLDSTYVTRYFQFAKNTDPVPQTLAHGDPMETQPFTIINK